MYLSDYYCFTLVRITYRIDTKKRETQLLLLASRYEVPENGLASRNEQRESPTPNVYTTTYILPTEAERICTNTFQGTFTAA